MVGWIGRCDEMDSFLIRMDKVVSSLVCIMHDGWMDGWAGRRRRWRWRSSSFLVVWSSSDGEREKKKSFFWY